jgi:hypothetical protein
MPSSIYGVPIYLAVALVSFVVVIVMGLVRGGWRQRAPTGGPVRMRARSMLQTVAAILGIVSFVMQDLQWLKIM